MTVNSFLVRWAGGWAERVDQTSIDDVGRMEGLLGLGALGSLAEVNRVADGQLAEFARPRVQTDVNVLPVDATDTPYQAFTVGDTVTVEGTEHRVLGITVTEDADTGRPVYVPTLNDDVVLGSMERLAQAITKMIPGTLGGRSKVAQPVVPVRVQRGLIPPVLEPPPPYTVYIEGFLNDDPIASYSGLTDASPFDQIDLTAGHAGVYMAQTRWLDFVPDPVEYTWTASVFKLTAFAFSDSEGATFTDNFDDLDDFDVSTYSTPDLVSDGDEMLIDSATIGPTTTPITPDPKAGSVVYVPDVTPVLPGPGETYSITVEVTLSAVPDIVGVPADANSAHVMIGIGPEFDFNFVGGSEPVVILGGLGSGVHAGEWGISAEVNGSGGNTVYLAAPPSPGDVLRCTFTIEGPDI